MVISNGIEPKENIVVMANNSDAYKAFLSNLRANKVPVAAAGQAAASMAVISKGLSIENLL